MSGNVPTYIREGCYVSYLGTPVKVTDYYFTSSPVHNQDILMVELEGFGEVEYHFQTITALNMKAALVKE